VLSCVISSISHSGLICKQDNTPSQSYNRVIYFLLAIKGLQVLLGPLYDYLDGRLLGHTLRKSEKGRLNLAVNMARQDVVLPGWKIHLPTTWTVICQLGIMVVVSWVVSFHLILRGNELTLSDTLRLSSESMTGTMQQSSFHALYMLQFTSCLIHPLHGTTPLLAKLAQSTSE
jgi:hypothetical protein